MLQGLVEALVADYVVSGNVSVAGIDAGADWNESAQAIQKFRNLFEAAAERELRSGGVLDQDGQTALGQVEPFGGGGDGGGPQQPLLAVGAAKRTGMQD